MGQVVVFAQPRTVDLEQYPDQALEANQVRLHTLYSGISAGTEITAYRGSNPYFHKQWDAERRLFVPGEAPGLRYPVSGWGYEEEGVIHLRPLISHVIPLADAAEAFRLLDQEPEQTLQVVLDMREFG